MNDAGNAVIGNAAPNASARLYVHAVNTGLVYGIFNDLNSTAATGFGMYCRTQNPTNSYNYFQARGTAGISRAVWTVAEGVGSTQNYGAFNTARNGSQLTVAGYNSVPQGSVAASSYSAATYSLNQDSLSATKYGEFIQLANGITNGTNYGIRVTQAVGAASTGTTGYLFHGKLDSAAAQTGSTNVGLYLDLVNGGGAGSTSRAIHTVNGDVKIEDLSYTTSNIVTADATGVLSTDNVPIAPIYTVATAPAVVIGGYIIVSDETGGPTMAFGQGGSWLRVSDGAPIV